MVLRRALVLRHFVREGVLLAGFLIKTVCAFCSANLLAPSHLCPSHRCNHISLEDSPKSLCAWVSSPGSCRTRAERVAAGRGPCPVQGVTLTQPHAGAWEEESLALFPHPLRVRLELWGVCHVAFCCGQGEGASLSVFGAGIQTNGHVCARVCSCNCVCVCVMSGLGSSPGLGLYVCM